MVNEKLINWARDEIYATALESGSRKAFRMLLDLYPDKVDFIVSQVSVKLEYEGYTERALRLEKLAKEFYEN